VETVEKYLSGKELYGDDFELEQIREWYEDEEEAYAALGAKDKASYHYAYHALNSLHGFKHLGQREFANALGLGSAYGEEFNPIIGKIRNLTIVDPSDAFADAEVSGVPCKYVKPRQDGVLPFEDQTFDLITSLGALHHIPNVTTVVNELYRCLAPNGFALIREPIVSMGDWTKPRAGLTARERGIPLGVFLSIVRDAGFQIRKQSLCVFPLIPKLAARAGVAAYNSGFITRLDALMCGLFSWNMRYHATKSVHKLRPVSVYFVLTR
jgi:SAM-dependent methyltransferase